MGDSQPLVEGILGEDSLPLGEDNLAWGEGKLLVEDHQGNLEEGNRLEEDSSFSKREKQKKSYVRNTGELAIKMTVVHTLVVDNFSKPRT